MAAYGGVEYADAALLLHVGSAVARQRSDDFERVIDENAHSIILDLFLHQVASVDG